MAHPTQDRNFRLPRHVRPSRYTAAVSIDPEARRFSGRMSIDLVLERPAEEIALHGVELEVVRAGCRVAEVVRPPSAVEAAPESGTILLRFAEAIPAGRAQLEIEWRGHMSAGLRGLYRAGPLTVTQFEAADARRMFPCFDEPAFKARWALAVDVPSAAATLGNAPVASVAEQGGRARIAFHETPPISSYLVALATGPLASAPLQVVRGIPVRTWAVPEKVRLAGFGQEVAVAVLPRLEDYFGLPYAFGKLDQVGVPDFEAGAMENAGLVTYREVALLLDPATAPLAQQKRVAEVVTHELSHMWFGNWVTMEWWDDLWLNEAFATWMAFKIVDGWRSDWRVWLEFDAGKAAAMQLDALASTHPIRSEVRNADEATESFDLITYEKGGAVLRMLEGFLGEAPFREGIRAYMRRHGKGNAVADDLWAALAEASRHPVVEVANAWIRQPGFPLVRVERQGSRLSLSQRRFFSDPEGREEGEPSRWPVPLVIRFADASGAREQRVLLRGPAETVELEAEGEVAWLCANGASTGFYRVAYDSAGAAALTRHLGALAPSERIGLLADAWALVRAGEQEVGDFLDLCAAFGGEEDHAVLDELVARLSVLEHRLEPDEARARFREFVAGLLEPALERLGWDPGEAEPDAVRLRRAALVRALGLTARLPALAAEAGRRLDRLLAGEAGAVESNLLDPAVLMVARGGDASRFEAFRERARSETDPAFQRRYLLALTAFEDAELSARAREMPFGDEVPLQDTASFVAGLLASRTAREPFWQAMRDRWEPLVRRIGGAPMLLRRVIEALGQLPERRHLEEVEAFLAAHPLEAARQAIAQTLERMRQEAALQERIRPAIAAWLGGRAAAR
jgi:puromycin-sensitive aminopeptidase